MSAEHNHPLRCCCDRRLSGSIAIECPGCPEHGVCICDLARSEPLDHQTGSHHEAFCPRFRVGPYAEQETTK